MARGFRNRRRRVRLGKPKKDYYTSSHPRPVKITYMEGFEPPVKQEPTQAFYTHPESNAFITYD